MHTCAPSSIERFETSGFRSGYIIYWIFTTKHVPTHWSYHLSSELSATLPTVFTVPVDAKLQAALSQPNVVTQNGFMCREKVILREGQDLELNERD